MTNNRLPRLLCLAISCAISVPALATSEPFTPSDNGQVLETLSYRGGDPHGVAARQRRAALERDPNNLSLAVDLAWRYIALGRRGADPRYYGYAEAVLKRWWQRPTSVVPPQILLVRATLRQNRHQFQAALADLNAALKRQPRNAQAWLTRATVLTVSGDYRRARQSCRPLFALSTPLLANACLSHAASLNGEAEPSYRRLLAALRAAGERDGETSLRPWALTLLAEIATRLGQDRQAEQHFRESLRLDPDDVYSLTAFSDFLLDRNRAAAVIALLADKTAVDALLLRLALAEQALGDRDETYRARVARLSERIATAERRAEADPSTQVHLGDHALFYLKILKQPQRALALALQNWQTQQREPTDARRVIEAALAADKPAAASAVIDWLRERRVQDPMLQTLIRQLEAKSV